MNKLLIYSGITVLAGIGLCAISTVTAIASKVVIVVGIAGIIISIIKKEELRGKLPCQINNPSTE